MKKKINKEDFGFQKSDYNFYLKTNPHIKKGSFRVKRKGHNFFWYYAFRSELDGKVKDYYLGKAFQDLSDDGMTSFQVALRTLTRRHNENFATEKITRRRLTYYIKEYIDFKNSQIENPIRKQTLTKETLKSHALGVRIFGKFLVAKKLQDIKVYHVENTEEIRKILIKYADWLANTKRRNGFTYTEQTIHTYFRTLRLFFEWLESKEFGVGLISRNPFDTEFVRQMKKKKLPRVIKSVKRTRQYFSPKGYEEMIDLCVKKCGEIWRGYVDTGVIERKHINQPQNVIGSDIVWFVSLLQLSMGFRLGEVLRSYRNEKHWKERFNKNEGSSFWFMIEDTYCIQINWKLRQSVLPTNNLERLYLRSWSKPPTWNKETPMNWKGKSTLHLKQPYYDTHIVDAMKMMFNKYESPYLFPSPNHKAVRPYSNSQYSMNFKQRCVRESNWEKWGINSSHDLRHAFITYNIGKKISPMVLSQITRHSVETMTKYYLEENIDIKGKFIDDIGIELGKYKPKRLPQ